MSTTMDKVFVEGIYAGWLAKIIGIRLGAPVEGWSSQQIKDVYGRQKGYLVDYRDFAADDDSNGPIFLLRALEDSGRWGELTAQDVADALLNYAPYEHGFFWWGGYGVSTEHTAYLNLWNGIPAPQSGSIEQNGAVIAQQIGGQIFIDTWGLVSPGNPDLAASLARRAASVTHDGEGVYGGIFVAVCISYAFVEHDICRILEKGLSYLPEDCEYARVVRTVMAFHAKHPKSWEGCYRYIHNNYGYDKYPGVCHIIPNIAVMILALLYGEGDFSDTLHICNWCGWDTDCNVGNVAAILGVRNGLDGIDYNTWRRPVNDFLACSGVLGSLNCMDIPYGALYIARAAAKLAGQELPEPFAGLAENGMDSCHFEYPGSTHAMRIRREEGRCQECRMENTSESADTGERSLKVSVGAVSPGEKIFVYRKTYYRPRDFHDSRYDPSFSPVVYPGQTVHGSVMVPEYSEGLTACLYVRELRTGKLYLGEALTLEKGVWQSLEYQIPPLEGAVIDEMGVCFWSGGAGTAVLLLDNLSVSGTASYSIEFARENEEVWNPLHTEISQFTRLRGLAYLEGGRLHLSCADSGEVYTGRHDWRDYQTEFWLTPVAGASHRVLIRVQGAMRCYAAGFEKDGRLCLYKKEKTYRRLAECEFCWNMGEEYRILLSAQEGRITVSVNGSRLLAFEDRENPYLEGAAGIAVEDGSHCCCRRIIVLETGK